MRIKRKNRIVVIVLTVVAAAVVMWLIFKPESKGSIMVQTAVAARADIFNSVTATGTVEPVTLVDVGTQVSGIIDKLYVDYNDHVSAGQLIAEMDKVTLEAELRQAEAQLASSKTEYEYRKKNYARTKTLYDKELVSDQEYDEALYLYETAENAYEQNQASIVGIRRNLGYATITSPIDGVVISRAVEEGQTVAAGFETPTLFTIANDLTDMQVVADVDEADIGNVEEGQRVEFSVDAYPDDVFSGTVRQVRLEATTESSVVTYEVVISAGNPDLKLKPGLTANVTKYTKERKGVVSVPSRALRFVPDAGMLAKAGLNLDAGGIVPQPGEGTVVWTVSGSTVSLRQVVAGVSDGESTEIISGIREGESVITGVAAEKLAVESVRIERSPFMPGPPGDDKQSEK